MTIYYVSLLGGRCGLVTNKRETVREQGTANILSICKATPAQIEWVRAMGGTVPQDGPRTRNVRESI